MSWLDDQPAEKLELALEKYRTGNSPVKRHDGGDERFGLWLALANQRCVRKIGLGIFDIADWLWRDAFDNGMSPAEAVNEALSEDDMFSVLFELEVTE